MNIVDSPRSLDWQERLFNTLLALSVSSWAVLGLSRSEPADRWSVVRLTIAVVHVAVAVLLLRRGPVRRHGTYAFITLALPALVVSGWAFKAAPQPRDWPVHAEAVFVCGAGFALIALFSLGRSFAILPALRGVVTLGPYRLIRHPAYLGELIMIAACCLASPTWMTALPVLVAVPAVVMRIAAEERTLEHDPAYIAYAQRVRRRLVPGLW